MNKVTKMAGGGITTFVQKNMSAVTRMSDCRELFAGHGNANTAILPDFVFDPRVFQAYRADLVREFTFDVNLVAKVDEFLWSLRIKHTKKADEEIVFVGIHVRRGDYGYGSA